MAVAIASILQESNTFSPVMTRYEDFSPVFGADALARHRGKLTEMGGFIDALGEARKRVAPVCAAWAITANRLVREDFERLVGDFTARLAEVRRPEAVLLAMHGAQTAEGEDDVEGHLLAETRRIVGAQTPIIVTLDLHANVTRRMAELANAIVGYHTYPHVDMYEIGLKAGRMLARMLAGELVPTMAYRKLPLIVPAENMQTTSGPMGRLIQRGQALERQGRAASVSIFGVQPWMDIEEMGGSVVVVTDGNAKAADRYASELASRFWDTRREFDVKLTPVKDAIRKALKIEGGPVVLAESSDSTGSGSPGDSTGVLKELLAADLKEPAAIFVVDPEAVAQCIAAGPGGAVSVDVGGKFDRVNSKPVRVNGRVRLVSDGRWVARARGYNTGIENQMGRAAVLEAGQVRILIAERSSMTVDPELFRSHGIDPLYMKIVVVKSPNGFRAAYEPIAKGIFIVDTPGVSTANLRSLPFTRVPRPIYPLDSSMRLANGRR
jgi:microcystin degradation protein MlrC